MTKKFDYSLEWQKSEPEKVLDVIKDVGIHRLGNLDGCICCSFSIRDVNVSVSCGKGSNRGCRIYSNSMDYPTDEKELSLVLSEVGDEIVRQINDLHDGRGEMPLHFRPWKKELDTV